jgi:hypothetical protein
MKNASDSLVFITVVRSKYGLSRARLLIDSLRTFGGELYRTPFWVFEANPRDAPCESLAGADVSILHFDMPEEVGHYIFADKVFACAQAEQLTASDFRSLVWIDPSCLVIKPPTLFVLDAASDAAVRPVHIQNVGLLTHQPIDYFWMQIYKNLGVRDIHMTVESFVDRQHLRAYFNSHAFSVNPSLGLMRRWADHLRSLVTDQEYQQSACQDEPHQIFLFQAILSTLLITRLERQRIRILPPDYNYPYNLQTQVPVDRRAKDLNDLVCIAYEDRSLDPETIDDISVGEPLRSWLTARAARTSD